MVDPDRPPIPYIYFPPVPGIDLVSNDLEHGGRVPEKHHADSSWGMGGDNVSPHLRWSGAPEGTQSFVVTCFDPDAPTGSGFWHWVLFDVPASTTELPRGAGSGDQVGLPPGAIHARNDAGALEYIGCAPPEGHGDHRYVFAVHALSVPTLGIDSSASPAVVGFNAFFNTIGRGVLIAHYGR
jgi:Raf kinase inhibitor-like YbhB/YbcL family protein